MSRAFPRTRRFGFIFIASISLIGTLFLLLAACGDDGDDANDTAADPQPTPTEQAVETPEPTETPVTEPDDEETVAPELTSTPVPAEATPTPEPVVDDAEPEEPAEDVDLAPELTGLTDWRNTEPVTLEELRGEPVVLVFWNSI